LRFPQSPNGKGLDMDRRELSVEIQPDSTEIAIFNRAYINSLRVVRYISKLSYKVELQLTMPSTTHLTIQPTFNQPVHTPPYTPPVVEGHRMVEAIRPPTPGRGMLQCQGFAYRKAKNLPNGRIVGIRERGYELAKVRPKLTSAGLFFFRHWPRTLGQGIQK
jgi:hypothetical protein